MVIKDGFVQYDPKQVSRGIVGRTESGLIVVTPEYWAWAEGLAAKVDELQLKIEQERISNLKGQ